METNLVIRESLTPEIVKKNLVRGNGNITEQEIMMFIKMCEMKNLNPFVNEAYLVKYSQDDASIITSKDVFIRRAFENPECDGWKAGIVVYNKETKEISEREGTIYIKTVELLAGGWCEVFFKNKKYTIKQTVPLEEYIQKKKDGNPNKFWATKPATMIRKVAISQALREAFPKDFSGLYLDEEIDPEEVEPQKVVIDITDDKKDIPIEEKQTDNIIEPGF